MEKLANQTTGETAFKVETLMVCSNASVTLHKEILSYYPVPVVRSLPCMLPCPTPREDWRTANSGACDERKPSQLHAQVQEMK